MEGQKLEFMEVSGFEDPSKASKSKPSTFTSTDDQSPNMDTSMYMDKMASDNDSIRGSFWNLSFYQRFFDVDTHDVYTRILYSFVPQLSSNFITFHLRPTPDLYGPFWICITLLLSINMSSNFGGLVVAATRSENYHWVIGFKTTTLTATVIFFYVFLYPLILWMFLRWKKVQELYGVLELVSAYGYSLSIFVPVTLLWLVPVNWFQWLTAILGLFFSATVLMISFWPMVNQKHCMFYFPTLCTMFVLHTSLMVFLKSFSMHPSYSIAAPSVSAVLRNGSRSA